MIRGLALVVLAAPWVGGCGSEASPPAPTAVVVRPVDATTQAVAQTYAPLVQACFGLPVRCVAPAPWPPRGDTGPSRDARALLDQLAPTRPPDAVALLGLGTERLRRAADPASGAVYGLGEARDRVAVWSLHGLTAGTPEQVRGRQARVMLHETGHALGLAHCDDPWCLMHDADDLRELDRTGLAPCGICWPRFCAVRGDRVDDRRAALVAAAQALGLTVASPAQAQGDRTDAPKAPTAPGGAR